jgi:hypothetical protein
MPALYHRAAALTGPRIGELMRCSVDDVCAYAGTEEDAVGVENCDAQVSGHEVFDSGAPA